MTIYDNVWHCMTLYEQCMSNVWQCVSNVWQEWMAGHSMQRLRVPGSVVHWSALTPGYSRSLYSTCPLFQAPFCCCCWHWASFLPLALCLLSGSFFVNIFSYFLSIFSQINLLATAGLFLLSLVANAFTKEPFLKIASPQTDSLVSLIYS